MGIRDRWTSLPRPARWTAAVWIAGFAEGTAAHVGYWLAGGMHYFHGQPIPIQVVFQALVVFDPLAAGLVARRQPAGPVLGSVVMAADLAANWWVQAGGVLRRPSDYLVPYGLLPISLFGLFVLLTARSLARAFRAAPA